MNASRWKSFWLTLAIFGTVNIELFAYFHLLPIEPLGKRGGPGRNTPL